MSLMRTTAIVLLVSAVPARAEPPCVPGSFGPNGCDSIRPVDEPAELPDFVLETYPFDVPMQDRGDTPRVLEHRRLMALESLMRERRRGDSTLPPVTQAPVGRDPDALRRYQAPYRFD